MPALPIRNLLVCLSMAFQAPIVHAETWKPETLSTADAKRLETGEVLVSVEPARSGSGGAIAAVIDIAIPPSCLMTTMRDCASAPKFIAGLESCRVLSQSPDGTTDVREHLVKWLWFLKATRSVFRSNYEGSTFIRFQRVDGDLRTLEGTWHLQAIAAGRKTRLFYEAHVDPGLQLPDAIVRAALELEVPKTLKALRSEGERRRDQCR